MTKNTPANRTSEREPITAQQIVVLALAMLDENGSAGLSLRRLASALNVTAMALYHHVGNRDALIGLVIDHVLCRLHPMIDGQATARTRLISFLESYGKAVSDHPHAFLCLFSSPAIKSVNADRISHQLIDMLEMADISSDKVELVRDILIDHVHGFTISLALLEANELAEYSFSDRYKQALLHLMDALVPDVA